MKKILIGMIIVLMLLIPSVVATSELKYDIIESKNNNDGNPDLVITEIRPDTGDVPLITGTEVTIKNVGDASFSGEIRVRLKVDRIIFGFLPIESQYTAVQSFTDNSFSPGEKYYMHFPYMPEERFRSFRFIATVDPFDEIWEENDLNNKMKERFFIFDIDNALFGWWDY
jgi:hypothetical protein